MNGAFWLEVDAALAQRAEVAAASIEEPLSDLPIKVWYFSCGCARWTEGHVASVGGSCPHTGWDPRPRLVATEVRHVTRYGEPTEGEIRHREFVDAERALGRG